jgi:CrcB protein
MFNRFAIYSFEFRALILIGLLGGFTTFSTFSLEAIDLWESGERAKMIIYLLTSLVLGLCATYGGIILGRKL